MLAVAIVATLLVAVIDWIAKLMSSQRVEIVAKPLTTVLVMWIAIAADGPQTATILALIGLLFCLVGDIALLDAVNNFVVGLAAFLVAHVVFIAMFVCLGLDHPLWGLAAAGGLAVYALTVAPRIVAGAARADAALRVPVIGYQLVISAMTIVAVMTGQFWAIFGAVAFVVSDTLLAWQVFVVVDEPFDESTGRRLSVAVMITYHAALIGLALSLH